MPGLTDGAFAHEPEETGCMLSDAWDLSIVRVSGMVNMKQNDETEPLLCGGTTVKKSSKSAAPTIYDIAKAAGVSPGTASRALNNIGYVKEETRQRVEAAVTELKYTPNRAARTLKTKKTGLVLLAIPDTDNSFYVDMIKAVQDVCKGHGYSMILYYTDGKAAEEVRALRMLREHYADAMILINFSFTAKHLKEIDRIQAPLVLSGICKDEIGGKPGDRFDYIGVDAEKGIYQAVRHLAQQGHVRIAYIAGPNEYLLFRERYHGYQTALAESGILECEELVLWCDYTEGCAMNAVRSFLALKEPPTAICCANDILAMAAQRTVQDMGLRVPEDMSVVGMDNIGITTKVRPMMSTVAIAQAEIGRAAASLVFSRLAGTEQRPSIRQIFEPRLIVRDSSIVCK